MRKNSKKKKIAYAFIAPAIISILVFTVVPIIYTVFISFTNYNMYHLEDFNMVGIANYLEVIREASVKCFSRCWDGLWYLRQSVRWGLI